MGHGAKDRNVGPIEFVRSCKRAISSARVTHLQLELPELDPIVRDALLRAGEAGERSTGSPKVSGRKCLLIRDIIGACRTRFQVIATAQRKDAEC